MIALLLAATMAAASPAAIVAQADAPDAVTQETWELDQLRIARTTDPAKLKALEGDHTIDAAMITLKRLGIPFTRLSARMLPGSLPEAIRTQIATLPPGEPFILPERDFFSISAIVGRKLPPGSARRTPDPAAPQDA